MKFVELVTKAEWQSAYTCLEQLRPGFELETMLSHRENLISRGYHLVAIIEQDKVMCVGSYHLHPHVARTNEFWVCDLVTLESARSQGYGLAMMNHMEELAKEAGCDRVRVHTGQGQPAEDFYQNKFGAKQHAVVFEKKLQN